MFGKITLCQQLTAPTPADLILIMAFFLVIIALSFTIYFVYKMYRKAFPKVHIPTKRELKKQFMANFEAFQEEALKNVAEASGAREVAKN